MKKMSVFLAILMIVTMIMPCTAFASESDWPEGIPENAEVHVVEIEIPPIEEDDGVSPQLWDQREKEMENGAEIMAACFATMYNYAAFETKAVVTSGVATGKFLTNFYDDGEIIRSVYINPDGTTQKEDWISLNAESTYIIRVFNFTGATIKATVTYYTWQ